MTIKEALEGPSASLSKTSVLPVRDYREQVREAGRSLFQEANIPGFCEELVEIIRPQFPDARVQEEDDWADGTTSLQVQWDFQPFEHERRWAWTITMYARPLTRELVVAGEVSELLEERQWKDPRVVEDAIVRAYRKPSRWLTGSSLVV